MIRTQRITLGGGCFWCIEAAFGMIKGVIETKPGYIGGDPERAHYKEVCKGDTEHVEVVQIDFDPSQITLEEILVIFYTMHDPTTLNRQGNDIGEQYKSAIFFHLKEHEYIIQIMIQKLTEEEIWENPIVTEVYPASEFFDAETYHDNYYEEHKDQPYCQFVITPKLNQLRKKFQDQIKS